MTKTQLKSFGILAGILVLLYAFDKTRPYAFWVGVAILLVIVAKKMGGG